MKDEAAKLLEKAARAIEAAKSLVKQGHVDFAAGRAYYAMFYVAAALLAERDLRFRKHGGVHAAFGEHFAKTAILDPKYHRWLLDAFDKRLAGDYAIEAVIAQAEVEEMIERAAEFLSEAQRLLNPARAQAMGQLRDVLHRPPPPI